MRNRIASGAGVLALWLAAAPAFAQPAFPWSDPGLDPDRRAELVLARMTLDEKIGLVHGVFPRMLKSPIPGVVASAGYISGVPRLGLPPLRESDASLGVAAAGRKDDDAAALPSAMLLASTWSPEVAFAGGAMIGKETRQKGFNVLLDGGVNLTRDPFNGRNFEYLGEDPLLAGVLDGAAIRGIQSQHVVSTAKHYALNDQETGRGVLDARMSEADMRESDLLAFEIAIEKGQPGSVMCSYNRVNGVYACENPHLLNDVLKTDWGWKGWVMSDWGAVHSLDAAAAGLDQESGAELDKQVFFDQPLRAAVASGELPQARLDDMVRRILRSEFAAGLVDPQPPLPPLDTRADARVAQAEAEAGVVLLKNDGVLPLAAAAKRIAVIGGHADIGVLSGGGSSQVIPLGSAVLPRPPGAPEWVEGAVYHPSAPLAAIKARAKGEVTFDDGTDPAAAAASAKAADVAIVFVEQWASEAIDVPIRLSDAQEALIKAVAAANPRTIVVLENGGPLLMPWIGQAKGVVEAWYPGMRGGEAIARILFGEVNPSGRLPVTFAAEAGQLARPAPPGSDIPQPANAAPGGGAPFPVDYAEGSSVGYRRFAEKGSKPLFAFGYGLSYTRFAYGALRLSGGQALTASVPVTNTGARAGVETVQFYLDKGPDRAQRRLVGWAQVRLEPGQTRTVEIAAEPRLLADWDDQAHGWRRAAGRYQLFAGPNAEAPAATGAVELQAADLRP
jgi:beta-glucosidase